MNRLPQRKKPPPGIAPLYSTRCPPGVFDFISTFSPTLSVITDYCGQTINLQLYLKCNNKKQIILTMNRYQKPSLAQEVANTLPSPTFELDEKQLQNLKSIAQVALAVSAVAGIALISVVAPNVLQLLKHIPNGRRLLGRGKDRNRKLSRAFYYLKERGYADFVYETNGLKMKLTQKGQKRIQALHFEKLAIPKAKSWDGRWWLVIADIPSKLYRSKADLFRKKIKQLGFYPLQRTVWFYPFDPRSEIAFISTHYGLDKFITTLKVEQLESPDEKMLKNYFKKVGLL